MTAPSSRSEIAELGGRAGCDEDEAGRARGNSGAARKAKCSGSKRSSRRRAESTGRLAAIASAGRKSSRKRSTECESRLVALAATELPLCLVGDLLERVKRQDERERLAAEVEVVRQILIERDDGLLALLAEAKAPPAIVRKVKKHLSDDRQSRAVDGRGDGYPAVAHDRVPGRCSTICAASELAELRREAEALLAASVAARSRSQ